MAHTLDDLRNLIDRGQKLRQLHALIAAARQARWLEASAQTVEAKWQVSLRPADLLPALEALAEREAAALREAGVDA